jgi:hypothetical protein
VRSGHDALPAGDRLRQRSDRVEERVRQEPAQAVATAFGIGPAAALVIGLVLRSRRGALGGRGHPWSIRAESTVNSPSNASDAIRRQMVQIRRKHHEDVREVIQGAEAVAGWGRHLRLYSWAALAAAAAVLWIVANRRRVVPIGEATAPVPAGPRPAVVGSRPGQGRRSQTGRRLGAAGSFLLGVAVRAAQNYAAHRVDQWLARQRMGAVTGPGPRSSDRGPQRPNGRPARPQRHPSTDAGPRSNWVFGGLRDERSCT